jgi:ethanolamine ammonia-lyase small subunit
MSAGDAWDALRRCTPARLALGRAGNALPTSRVLEFQLAHARARDAVARALDAEGIAAALAPLPSLVVESQATDRAAYLANPHLGRVLSDVSREQLKRGKFDVALVIADGLSATAVNAHAAVLAKRIVTAPSALTWAPIVIVRGGRVAIGDDIAYALGAEMAIVLIGERPGLSAADSVGIYLTFRPLPGVTKDAERNCISNVRPGGLALEDAAYRAAWIIGEARRLRLTGVALKEDAGGIPLTRS